jgi:hypothetical protein
MQGRRVRPKLEPKRRFAGAMLQRILSQAPPCLLDTLCLLAGVEAAQRSK